MKPNKEITKNEKKLLSNWLRNRIKLMSVFGYSETLVDLHNAVGSGVIWSSKMGMTLPGVLSQVEYPYRLIVIECD